MFVEPSCFNNLIKAVVNNPRPRTSLAASPKEQAESMKRLPDTTSFSTNGESMSAAPAANSTTLAERTPLGWW